MNKRQTDKITSHATLKITLEHPDNKPVWSALPAFERGVTQFYGSMNVLAALERAQGASTKGITVDKNQLADSVINRTIEIGGAVAAYASAVGDANVLAQASFSKSALRDLRDAELDDRAQAVHDTAADLVAKDAKAMGDYGLTTTKLTDLQSAITAYSAMVGSPRAAIAGKAAITTAIEGEFARTDKILSGQLDRLVVQFETTHPQFVSAYRSARNVVATGSRGANGAANEKPAKPTVLPQPATQPTTQAA